MVVKMDASAPKEVLSVKTEGLFHFGLHNVQGWVATTSESWLHE